MVNFTPKYILIQNYIIEKINSGEFKVGDVIPSENELSKMFKVSRVTSNKAIAELSMMGIVERVRGKGTYIRAIKTTNLNLQGISHILSESYKVSSEISESHSHTIVSLETVHSTPDLSNKLNLSSEQEVYIITRVMEDNKIPVAIDYTIISKKIFGEKEPNHQELSNYNIQDYLKNILNLKPKYVHIHLDSRHPDDYERKVLNVEETKAMLVWDTIIIDEKRMPLSMTTTIVISELYKPFINFELE